MNSADPRNLCTETEHGERNMNMHNKVLSTNRQTQIEDET